MIKHFKLYFILLLSILLFFNIIFIIQINGFKKQVFETDQKIIYKEQDISYQKLEFEEKIRSILSYLKIGNWKIKDINVVKYEINEKKSIVINMNKIIDCNKIVLRFFQTSCSACITDQIAKLNVLSRKMGKNKIILLTDFVNEEIYWYLIKNKIDLEIYEIRNADLGIEFDKQQIPYIFICDKNLKINSPFVISIKSKEYSEYFYESITNQMN